MYQVFKSLIVSNIVCRDIDLYGGIVNINRRLSNDIVRKRLANCFVYTREHNEREQICGFEINISRTSHWLGYLLHRDNDLPAIFDGDNLQKWYQYGELHRDGDKPAYILYNLQRWYQHGKLHRDNDKPAYIDDGDYDQRWYQYGKLHRDNDKPAIVYGDDDKKWYQYGKLHRDNDKPAYIDGDRHKWYKNGKEYHPDLEK